MGDIARDRGEPERAIELLTRSLAICREHEFNSYLTLVLNGLGDVACTQGNLTDAVRLFWEAFELLQKDHNINILGIWPLRNLAWVSLVDGGHVQVLELLEVYYAWFEDQSAQTFQMNLLHLLSAVSFVVRRTPESLDVMCWLLQFNLERQQPHYTIEALELVVLLASRVGLDISATRLLSAATALRQHYQAPVPPAAVPLRAHAKASLEQLLATNFEPAWAAGSVLTVEQAVSEAIELLHNPALRNDA
jgi:tetratricopeptide (TPR) repeat protein